MKDELRTVRGTLETLVRGLQHDSGSRVATPSRVVAEKDNRANLIEPNLLSSSSNAVLLTISGMKKLIAKNVLTDYMVHNVKQFPQNLVISVKDPERERKRIIRVIEYMMSFATEAEKADITCPQPLKSSTTWVPWFS